ncbi:hypothetical protein AVEN_231318-1 [Araneus ventricosus]|uniref:Uncharacterized protein n=1 Tax=Araneus ventricosus TaxID=182803 RepID=A0A4Y2CHF6_ARAVE|nr:hypothetical protein AVEN_231318-1 [Araneus ventricosus]
MMRNTLSDLSGTSLSIAREKSWPFRGVRYQGVDCSARWGIEGVPWWRSSDFLWPQLRANTTAPGQRIMTTGTQLFRHDVPLARINAFGLDFFALVTSGVRPVRVVVVFAACLISTGIHHFLPMCYVCEDRSGCFRIFMYSHSISLPYADNWLT